MSSGVSKFIHILIAAMLVFGRFNIASADDATIDSVRAEFFNPQKNYRPMIRWWWPGGDVDDGEIRREIRLFDDAYFGGVEIQPFRIGLTDEVISKRALQINNYLTPVFFSSLRTALEESAKRGMWVDYTFGSGWPFGGGEAITPELSALELRFSRLSVRGPKRIRQHIVLPSFTPGWGTYLGAAGVADAMPEGWFDRIRAREKLVAVVAARGDSRGGAEISDRPDFLADPIEKSVFLDSEHVEVLTSRVDKSGVLEWDVPAGNWQIFIFAQVAADLRVTGGVGHGPQLVIDHMNRQAFEAHAARVGDSMRQPLEGFFGKGLRSIFCDGLELIVYLPWTEGFLKEFESRRGYDLTPFLPILKVPGGQPGGVPFYDMENIGDSVRDDYWQTVSELMLENFFTPFTAWAKKNNLQSRVQAHFAQVDLLQAYGSADIPETEALAGSGNYRFLKLASSAAHGYGKEVVSSESYTWAKGVYNSTPEMIVQQTGELIAAGVNQMVYHGFPYQYPGYYNWLDWHPFSPEISSHLSEKNPFWKYISTLNKYITRLQYASRQGINVAPVALYRQELWDSIREDQKGQKVSDIEQQLANAGYNFDYINAHILAHSSVVGGSLQSPGKGSYKVIIFDDVHSIPASLAKKISEFSDKGLHVVFLNSMPSIGLGPTSFFNPGYERERPFLKGIDASLSVHNTASATATVSLLKGILRSSLSFPYKGSVPFVERNIDGSRIFIMSNPSPMEKTIFGEFIADGSPEIWNPWTGKTNHVDFFERGKEGVRLQLDLLPYESRIIVFNKNIDRDPVSKLNFRSRQERNALMVGVNGWDFAGVGVKKNGRQANIKLKLAELIDWSLDEDLKDFSGTGVYTTEIYLHRSWMSYKSVILDLGRVGDVAEIRINSQGINPLLLRPYRVDIKDFLRSGNNLIEVAVTNSLTNAFVASEGRNIGLELNEVAEEFMRKMNALPKNMPVAAGLMGPVKVYGYD